MYRKASKDYSRVSYHDFTTLYIITHYRILETKYSPDLVIALTLESVDRKCRRGDELGEKNDIP